MALHQRLDRQLDEIRAERDGLVEQPECGGIDHVLRIMEHHHREAPARARLVGDERGIETVEAIGLGARPVAVMDHEAQARIALRRRARRRQCRGIVAVAADIEPHGGLRPAGEKMGDGIADHRGLVPGGDDHRRRAMQRTVHQRGALAQRGFRAACRAQPQPQRIHGEVVGRADQEEDPGKQQQFML